MEFLDPFAPPTLLCMAAQKSSGVSGQFTSLSCEGLVLAGEKKGGLAGLLCISPVLHLIWEAPGKDPRY